jgi:hypothetical protein
VYLNKETNFQPQLALGDMVSMPIVSHVDPDGNLYVGDHYWQRVLVYKAPFSAFGPPVSTFTPTATRTTPTATATQTPTPTYTPTMTATPTNTPPPSLISGHGKNACMMEWFTEPTAVLGRNGFPARQLSCTDDDAGCDFGAATGDNSCTFHVALCLNVMDSRFPCFPIDVATLQILRPNEAKPKGAVATANRDALENALASLGGTIRGLCTNTGPHHGQACAVAADCDSTPGRGDGVCRGRLVTFAPPFTANNICTPFAPIQVPLRQTLTRTHAERISLSAVAISSPLAHRKGGNRLKLTCKPHA